MHGRYVCTDGAAAQTDGTDTAEPSHGGGGLAVRPHGGRLPTPAPRARDWAAGEAAARTLPYDGRLMHTAWTRRPWRPS